MTARSLSVQLEGESPVMGLPYVITPERRALLNTIRFAEGTWKGGLDLGYRVMFGGGLMASLDRHPDRVIYSSRYASAAARLISSALHLEDGAAQYWRAGFRA